MRKSFQERFEEKLAYEPNCGCWLWTGGSHSKKKPYGKIRKGRKKYSTHRVAYELYIGKIPENLHVLHKCDMPACCNPDHLFVGTNQDNMTDMVKKNRSAKGSEKPDAKLTEKQIPAIRKDTRICREIAADYGVGRRVINDIKLGRAWRHVK